MHKVYVLCISICLCLTACMGGQSNEQIDSEMISTNAVGDADAFNPWRQSNLPTSKHLSNDGKKIVQSMGGHAQSIQGEAAHRQHWREEIYPIVFGSPAASHEVIVVIDFAMPKSEEIWREVVKASKNMSPQNAKIVVFGKNTELYGTDLIGLMIWISHARKGQAMNYLTYALSRWNEVKAQQRSKGNVKKFNNEYDSTANTSDYPIHYMYLSKLNPSVPESEELKLSKYCYDAGNVNMYQAMQVAKYYNIHKVPAVIVDGKVLSSISSSSIIDSMR